MGQIFNNHTHVERDTQDHPSPTAWYALGSRLLFWRECWFLVNGTLCLQNIGSPRSKRSVEPGTCLSGFSVDAATVGLICHTCVHSHADFALEHFVSACVGVHACVRGCVLECAHVCIAGTDFALQRSVGFVFRDFPVLLMIWEFGFYCLLHVFKSRGRKKTCLPSPCFPCPLLRLLQNLVKCTQSQRHGRCDL